MNRGADQFGPLYTGHRTQVTASLLSLAAGQRGARLALLGAGNCHDVDVGALAGVYSTIHLFDIDADAVHRAIERQSSDVRHKLVAHVPVDLGGINHRLEAWSQALPEVPEVQAAIDPGVQRTLAGRPDGFDVAASLCMATQMVRSLRRVVDHDRLIYFDLLKAQLTIHMRVLTALLRVGGSALLLTDLVSSSRYPLEDVPADKDLSALVSELTAVRNFVYGSDPNTYAQIMRKDPILGASAGPRRRIAPWIWRASPERMFLVCGFAYERVATASSPT